MKYRLVVSSDPSELASLVEALLDEGWWKLYGNPFGFAGAYIGSNDSDSTRFCQALIKE